MSRPRKHTSPPQASPKLVRCAIYTRKSTEEGLQQEFNSLNAQREAAEAFIASQKHEGWTCLPTAYDDGGYTGGNMDRPALQRLLADIQAGFVDCVVVYKIDRLSRSLLDFARLIEVFERHHVAFVSTTQQFSTSTSMGRLVLNVLLSFAQFEREIIAERTRDKIAATRRKGKWSGGPPVLGYDLDPERPRLVVNAMEAAQVRDIFHLYLEHEALLPVVRELAHRGWTNKRWTTRKGQVRGGQPFTKNRLHQLLTNVLYTGQLRYKQELHPGEHPALVEPEIWQKVQITLARNGRNGGGMVRNSFGAILKGLLRCGACACSMTPTHTTRHGKRYRYYVCLAAQQRGWDSCPAPSISAGALEALVLQQVQQIVRDPALLAAALREAATLQQERAQAATLAKKDLERDIARWHCELERWGQRRIQDAAALVQQADLQERIRQAEERLGELQVQGVAEVPPSPLDPAMVRATLEAFSPVWEVLAPHEQTQLINLLVQQVIYDGRDGSLSITFHPTGLQAIAPQAA